MKFNKELLISIADRVVATLFIVLIASIFLYQKNADVLFMAQLRSLFMSGSQFWNECMVVPGGGLAWLGCWFTQLFYEPECGVMALAAIWIATFFALTKAFRIRHEWCSLALIPVICMLFSIVWLGYWLYYLKQPGYFFRESLGVLYVALMMLAARVDELPIIAKNKFGVIAANLSIVLWAAITYPLTGYYAVLAMLCLAVRFAVARNWASLATTALGFGTIFIIGNAYTTMRADEIFTIGFPVFECDRAYSPQYSVPFYISGATLLLLNLAHKLPVSGKPWKAIAPVVSLIIMAAGFYLLNENNEMDENFHRECRMYAAVDNGEWEKALDDARTQHGNATREIVLLKNVALFNAGNVGNEMYHYNNMGEAPHITDSLQVHLADLVGPLLYLHHGRTNFCIRWCIESSVEQGIRVCDLRILAQASLVNGEYEAARKYFEMLKRTRYYKEWAEHFMPIVDGKKDISEYPEFKNIIDIRSQAGSALDSDQGLCEIYLLKYFAYFMQNQSKYLQEICLIYAMEDKDIGNFWNQFFNYASMHQGEDMPIHYQEAAYLYSTLEPGRVDTSHMPFDKARIIDRYAEFQRVSQGHLSAGMSNEQIGAMMESEFGDTFWWAYFFARGLHSY